MATTLKNADYLAAAANLITTGMNSLASAAAIDSSVVDNTQAGGGPAGALFADFLLSLASLAVASASAYVALYLVPAVDGTNYGNYATGTTPKIPAHYFVGNLLFNILTGAQVQALTRVELPAGLFKIVLVNNLGVAMASSGNTLSFRAYNYQGV